MRAESRGLVPRSYRIGLDGWKSESLPLLLHIGADERSPPSRIWLHFRGIS